MDTQTLYTTWISRRAQDAHKQVLHRELVDLFRSHMPTYMEFMLRVCKEATNESDLVIPIRIATDYVGIDRSLNYNAPETVPVEYLVTSTRVLYDVTLEVFGATHYCLEYSNGWIRLRYYPEGLPPPVADKLVRGDLTPRFSTPVAMGRTYSNTPPRMRPRSTGVSSPLAQQLAFDEL